MDLDSQREQELFDTAVGLTAPDRAAFLDEHCGGDSTLRRRIHQLLQAHDRAEGFLDPVVPRRIDTAVTLPSIEAGTLIGPYRIIRRIGEGGCGIVYGAEQLAPVHREVALKVIKLGMDTREVIGRFALERQALALMDHPNIAHVYDAGATEAGRSYFAMELIRGPRITEYCDAKRFSPVERVKLFIEVCSALEHAHQKGIIHRDLKPSNILVMEIDGRPVPKVIDFGIAKATQGRLPDETTFTAWQQFVGTPAYMSPEQAALGTGDIDTRSDIYSLGVLLYELLTGRTPFDTKQLLAIGFDTMRQRIREVQSPRPSSRLNTLEAGDLARAAATRATVAPKLIHAMRGDLDWIVMRCLEKDRGRRYQTATELASDLGRYLRNEPVLASPPSSIYLAGKWLRRNRLAAASAAVIGAAILGALAVSLEMYARERLAREQAMAAEERQAQLRKVAETQRNRATAAEREQRDLRERAEAATEQAILAEQEQSRQRQAAETARDSEAHQRAIAEGARASEAAQRIRAEAAQKQAETEAAKARQIATFLSDMLKSVGPSVARGRDTSLLREILDQTAERIGRELKDQPEVSGALRRLIGTTYQDLGDLPRAEEMLREAQGAWNPANPAHDEARAMNLFALGGVLLARGRIDEADAVLQEAMPVLHQAFGDDPTITAASMGALADIREQRGDLAGAEELARSALAAQRRADPRDVQPLTTAVRRLVRLLIAQGERAAAEPLINEWQDRARKLDPNTPEYARNLSSLAWVFEQNGDHGRAEALLRESLTAQRRVIGPDHPDVVQTLDAIAQLARDRGDHAMAEGYYREALAIERKQLGPFHPQIAVTTSWLAVVIAERGDKANAEAEQLARDALAIAQKSLRGDDSRLVVVDRNLGYVRHRLHDPAGAEKLYHDAIAIQRRIGADDDSSLAGMLVDAGDNAIERTEWRTAESDLLEANRILDRSRAVDPAIRRKTTQIIAKLYAAWAYSDPKQRATAQQWDVRRAEMDSSPAGRTRPRRSKDATPRYANKREPTSAMLRDDNGNLVEMFTTTTNATVDLIRVDDAKLGIGIRGGRDIYVAPGYRRITLQMANTALLGLATLQRPIWATETVEYAFGSGKRYRFTATRVEDSFDLSLWDETAGRTDRVRLRTWRLPGVFQQPERHSGGLTGFGLLPLLFK